MPLNGLVKLRKAKAISAARAFRASNEGAVAVTVALFGAALTLSAGIGIDVARIYFAKATAQETVDQAVVAAAAVAYSGGGSVLPNETRMKEVVTAYLSANAGVSSELAGLAEPQVTYQPEPEDRVTVSVAVKIETTFLRIANIDEINFTLSSSARRPDPDIAAADLETRNGPLELALVVDRSPAMSGGFGDTTKAESLRKPVISLIERVMAEDEAKVGIVPFGTWLRLERRHWFDSWLDLRDLSIEDEEACLPSFRRQCVALSYVCSENGSSAACNAQETCEEYGGMVCSQAASAATFNGCFMTRPSLPDSIASPTDSPYPAKSGSCLQTPIMDLTKQADFGGRGIDVARDRLAQMIPVDDDAERGTYIPAGLEFGWQMLAAGPPFDRAATREQIRSLRIRKAMVLVSGGGNSVFPTSDGEWRPYVRDALESEDGNPASNPDLSTRNLCSKMKDAGIIIYVVAMSIDDPDTADMLRDCASSPNSFYQADSPAELERAFSQIGGRLTLSRLTN